MKNKTVTTILFIVLALVLGFATYSALVLSLAEMKTPGTCPALGPVPACYVVLLGYGLGLIGHLLSRLRLGTGLFVFGLAIPTILAVIGTVGQLGGFIECPKTDGNTPMCYLSLGMCSICWVLWILIRKSR